MYTRYFVALEVLAFAFSPIAAWNTDVHQQIGYMAENFLTSYTSDILGEILESQYNKSIGLAAAWADAYAHTKEGRYSYQWHWIDAHDNPPTYCHVDYKYDCAKGGCIVSAIANQTEILRGCIDNVKNGLLSGGSNMTCSNALKWVTHFVGDIAQPLHSSGLGNGGNLFNVTFGGKRTELHAVWDGEIIYADAGVTVFPNASIHPFMINLVDRINKDSFSVPTSEWLSCTNPNTPQQCALAWARDSNTWTCRYVYKYAYNNTDLLESGYAKGAYPIVELQISKAALRLGTWLNILVGKELNKGSGLVLQRPLS
ncbi:nuclease PA3 [Patellaria atrata CBS 101060]|uniref:Nuclease PA3 n=1 Tax=Patellaria atrata CBS 101060 TaxID=1346257 RepID=A0A9P4VRB2_9PEZI|nr:nuclease PA3 [Patellaria atrata CBS 101060]